MRPTAVTITLDTPTVNLFGERTASAGFILAGKVCLSFRTATKVRALDLSLFGEQVISFIPRARKGMPKPTAADTVVLNKCLADIPQRLVEPSDGSKSVQYAAGTHALHFEIVLPGDLPASAVLLFGRISYCLRARLVLTGLRSTCTAEVPVVVARNPGEGSEWAAAAFDALCVSAKWADKLRVTLSRDSRALTENSSAEFTVTMDPSIKNLRLTVLDLLMKEIQSVHQDGAQESPAHKEVRVVARKRVSFGREGVEIDGTDDHRIRLRIPEAYGGVQYECESPTVAVTHHLVLTALIQSPEGSVIEVSLPTHVSVLPRASTDGGSDLPLYEKSGHDQLIQASEPPPAQNVHRTTTSRPAPASSETASSAETARALPPYSLPVCDSCGKEDISVLECRKAIVRHSRMRSNAEIEDLCAELANEASLRAN
ncbi:hypothetical protein GQ54DRAFT_52932 [Martensiomyces pterosporus]|nr:hypothetical protein GQ54DRAFT_52932 [Martensiomyces pterosporus]